MPFWLIGLLKMNNLVDNRKDNSLSISFVSGILTWINPSTSSSHRLVTPLHLCASTLKKRVNLGNPPFSRRPAEHLTTPPAQRSPQPEQQHRARQRATSRRERGAASGGDALPGGAIVRAGSGGERAVVPLRVLYSVARAPPTAQQ